MAKFSKLVITSKGQALLAKMIEGSGTVEFTKISASSATYEDEQLEGLTSLSDVEQTSLVSKITRTNEVAVRVEAAFTNTELTAGYYMKALGLYAVDPDAGEILYAVTRETSGNCYLPAYNGITVSGAYVQLVTTVGNAENVSLEVDAAAVATVRDIQELQRQIDDLEAGASDNVPENLWLVDDSTTTRLLSVVTDDFSACPASDTTHAYVADAQAVGMDIENLSNRISSLEGAGASINLKKVTLTINKTITVGTYNLTLQSHTPSQDGKQTYTYIADSEQDNIMVAIPVVFSAPSNQKFIGLIYGWISAISSNTGALRFFSRTGESSSTFTGFDYPITGGGFSTLVENL